MGKEPGVVMLTFISANNNNNTTIKMKTVRYWFIILALILVSNLVFAQETPINIWSGTACKSNVKLTPYLAEGKDNPAIIVCPGGSYFWLDKKTEGKGVAEWLQSDGISAFVLEYRVGGVPAFITHYRLVSRGNRYPDMLQDVQRSIQIVRENASRYGINANEVGVMGFSAGGHLAIMSGLFLDSDVLSLVGIEPEVSLKPNHIGRGWGCRGNWRRWTPPGAQQPHWDPRRWSPLAS